ncbi:hypothetical protein ABK040_011527 [Willaertia magna]
MIETQTLLCAVKNNFYYFYNQIIYPSFLYIYQLIFGILSNLSLKSSFKINSNFKFSDYFKFYTISPNQQLNITTILQLLLQATFLSLFTFFCLTLCWVFVRFLYTLVYRILTFNNNNHQAEEFKEQELQYQRKIKYLDQQIQLSNERNKAMECLLEKERNNVLLLRGDQSQLEFLEFIELIDVQNTLIKSLERVQQFVLERSKPIASGSNGSNLNTDSIRCPICLDKRKDCVIVPCGHTFCNHCIDSNKLKACPLCREKIQQLSKMYL